MSHNTTPFKKNRFARLKKSFLLFVVLPFSVVTYGQKSQKKLSGTASFYANKFNGRPTATGELFTQANLTAASNFFKFHSWVRITNLLNGKSVIVRINDRMHPDMAKKGRIVDLTKAAAKELGCAVTGLIKVMVEKIPLGPDLLVD
jgi:rare lipoprotein A